MNVANWHKMTGRDIVQESKLLPCWIIINAEARICRRKWDPFIPLDIWDLKATPNPGQKTRPNSNKQKKKQKN